MEWFTCRLADPLELSARRRIVGESKTYYYGIRDINCKFTQVLPRRQIINTLLPPTSFTSNKLL